MNELADCPFCGGSDRQVCTLSRHGEVRGYFVYCYSCSAQGGYNGSEDGAEQRWNRRVHDAGTATEPKLTPERLGREYARAVGITDDAEYSDESNGFESAKMGYERIARIVIRALGNRPDEGATK